MNHVNHAAPRRNDYSHPAADQTLNLESWARPIFPAADLIERRTRRPAATCEVLARIAGYHELEVR